MIFLNCLEQREKLVRTLAVLSCLLAVAGAMASAGASGILPTDLVLQTVIRGADPGPCTQNYYYYPCTENAETRSSCWGADNNQPGCDPTKSCAGCNGSAWNSKCNSSKPWNAICDTPQTIATGCGKFYVIGGATCNWNANNSTCRCAGTAGVTDCAQVITYLLASSNQPNPPCILQQ